ncbi:MAG: hypothetical protein LBJ35_01620 [Spirochaetaceae bacterium]|jgi:hypothetical protein|nr:hypothetical protein [Spirochaetaceae bacterium]
MFVRKTIVFTVILFLAYTAAAQDDDVFIETETPEPAAAAQLPRTFRDFSLGMNLEDLKAALKADPAFVFRGDRDVSFLPNSNQNLVDSAGSNFIKRAFFQIKDDSVFVMTFEMDTEKVDHYSVFTTFSNKYGGPLLLDPRQSEWEDGETRIYIERPLTVKYIDKGVFDSIVSESRLAESSTVLQKQEFLNDF